MSHNRIPYAIQPRWTTIQCVTATIDNFDFDAPDAFKLFMHSMMIKGRGKLNPKLAISEFHKCYDNPLYCHLITSIAKAINDVEYWQLTETEFIHQVMNASTGHLMANTIRLEYRNLMSNCGLPPLEPIEGNIEWMHLR